MTIRASLLFAQRLIFPRAGKKSSARKSVIGAIVCIAISIVPLIAVISVAHGMIDGMTERIIGLSSGHLKTFVYRNSPYAASVSRLSAVAETVSKINGVTNVYPELSIDALASGNRMRSGIELRAIPPKTFQENKAFAKYLQITEGSFDAFLSGCDERDEKKNGKEDARDENERNGGTKRDSGKYAIVGEKVASVLNLHAGDTIRIITTNKRDGKNITPRLSSFKICAIVSSGYQELDALWVFIPIDTAFEFAASANASFSLIIQTEDAFSSDLYRIRKEIDRILSPKALTYTWSEINEAQLENFSSTKMLLIFTMVLIVLVASVNISSALVMLVMERRREIAIVKSMGGTSHGIMLSFLAAGIFCGLFGIAIGAPIGILCAVNINGIISLIEKILNSVKMVAFLLSGGDSQNYINEKLLDPAFYLSEIPVAIPISEIVAVLAFVLVLCMLVSILPSIRAGKEKPLDIIRKA